MKKDLVRLATVGLLAGFCLSAQGAPSEKQEVAMSKCSKDNTQKSQNENDGMSDDNHCSGNGDDNHCSGNSGCNNSEGDSDSNQQAGKMQTMQSKRKSAAQKAVEGN